MTSVHDSDNDAIFGKNLSVYGKKAAGSRPLWEVMEESTGTVAEWGDMIRAVRDWLVPEEQEPENAFETEGYVPMRLREDRQRLRALLTAEADRAERGDHD